MSPLKPFQSKIIVLFAQQELRIAELYRFYASLYPDLREFWTNLSMEQMEFATWIEYFYKKSDEGTAQFQEGNVKTYTVESFVKFLEDNLVKVKEKAPTLQAAFRLALDIENSLIVKKVFDRFQSADRKLATVLATLRDRKRVHLKQLEVQSIPFAYPLR
jgi:hypothetical protein